MCGIVGYVGTNNVPNREYFALDVVLEGLRRLEYRGYDSAGVAACLNSAALDAAGILPIAEAALYPGSWSQWAADSNLPAEIGCRDTAE